MSSRLVWRRRYQSVRVGHGVRALANRPDDNEVALVFQLLTAFVVMLIKRIEQLEDQL